LSKFLGPLNLISGILICVKLISVGAILGGSRYIFWDLMTGFGVSFLSLLSPWLISKRSLPTETVSKPNYSWSQPPIFAKSLTMVPDSGEFIAISILSVSIVAICRN
jgi:hypothetical protein